MLLLVLPNYYYPLTYISRRIYSERVRQLQGRQVGQAGACGSTARLAFRKRRLQSLLVGACSQVCGQACTFRSSATFGRSVGKLGGWLRSDTLGRVGREHRFKQACKVSTQCGCLWHVSKRQVEQVSKDSKDVSGLVCRHVVL